jgi:hypothetical protein
MADFKKLGKGVTGALTKAKEMAQAKKAASADQPGVHYADPLKPADMRMSEALGNAGAEGKTLNFTEADRSRVFGPNRGGVGFSGLQHYSLPHKKANTVWGFGNTAMAEKKIRQNDPENSLWTTFVGSPTQHKSNSVVIGDAIKKFQDSVKKGVVPPEQIMLMNKRLNELTDQKTGAKVFEDGFDLTDPAALKVANTFSRRAAVGDVMLGLGVKGPMTRKDFKSEFPNTKFTDGSDIENILKRETDPDLVNAGTYDVGNGLFVLDGKIIQRPDLNEAFPVQVTGTDLGMKYELVPPDKAMRDFYKAREGRKDKNDKPSPVTYYDLARAEPSQLVDEDYLTFLQKEGYKKGGTVNREESPEDMARFQKRFAMHKAIGGHVKKMAGGGKVSIFDKPVHMVDGGKIGRGVMGAVNKAKQMATAERDANLQRMLEPSKVQQRLYHGTTATEGGKGQEAIRRLKPSKEGALGSGVYMTPNTPHASSYTGIPNDEALELMRQGGDYSKKMADQFMADRKVGRLREGQAGGNMLPVYAQIKNPLIIGKSGRNIDPAADALMGLGMDEASAVRLVEKAFEEKGNIGKQIQSRAQAQGYDGIMQYRGDDLSEVVSYNPNAIKSAIGNQGTYDLTSPDLSKANGGAMRMPPKKTEGFEEEAPKSKSIFDTVRQAVRQVPKVATTPLGVGLNAGYAGYKYLTGEDPLEDLRRKLDAKLNPPINTGSEPVQQFEQLQKARGGLTRMAEGGESIDKSLKRMQNYSVGDQGAKKPNELGGVILAGASWMAGDEKTKLAKQAFGEDVTNTAIGGQKTADVLNQLNVFKRDGGTFAPNTTVVLDIGANDIAQGVDEATIRANLNEIVSRLGDEGVQVILSGQPEAHSYEEAISSTNLQMDDLYQDIAANNPNVTLVDAMSGMLNDKTLMDESGFHLNSDDAKLSYLNQFANAYKGMNEADQEVNQEVVNIPKETVTDIPPEVAKEIEQILQVSNPEQTVTEVPEYISPEVAREIEQILEVSKPEERYIPEEQVYIPEEMVEQRPDREPSAGYLSAQQNQGLDTYYQDINRYVAENHTPEEIQQAMEYYGVSQADVDAARDFQPSGAGRFDESYATESYAKGGRVQESPEDMARFHKRFAMHKAIGGSVKKMAGGGRASIFDAPAKRMSKGGSSDEPTTKEIAEQLGKLAVEQGKEEYESFKKPRAATDIANRGILAPAVGAPVDLINMGLAGIDFIGSKATGKPIRLSSEKPFGGSEHLKELMDKYGVTSGEDRPMTETMLSLFSPTGMIKGAQGMTKGAVKAAGAMRKPMSGLGAMREKTN